jgi:hypothetical protein
VLSGVLVVSFLVAVGMWVRKGGGGLPCVLYSQYESSDDEGGELEEASINRKRRAGYNQYEQKQPLKGYSSV